MEKIYNLIKFIFKFILGNKNLVLIYIFTFLTAIFGYLIKMFLARILSPNEFGILFAIIGFLLLIAIFTELGFTYSLNYFGVEAYVNKKWDDLSFFFILSFTLRFILTILFSIFLFYFGDFLLINYFGISLIYLDLFYVLIGYFVFVNLKSVVFQIFNIRGDYYFLNFLNFLEKIITFLILILIFSYSKNIIFLSSSYFITMIIIFLISSYILFSTNKGEISFKFKFKFNLLKKYFSYSFSIFLSMAMLIIIRRTDVSFITYFLGTYQVGLYEVAFSVVTIMSTILLPFITMIQPKVKKLKTTNKIIEIKKLISNVEIYLFITGIPLILLYLYFSNLIVTFLFGVDYTDSHHIVKFLSVAIFFQLFQNFYFFILSGLGEVKSRNKILLIGVILNICLNIFGVIMFGISGVVSASAITFLFMAIGGKFLINRVL